MAVTIDQVEVEAPAEPSQPVRPPGRTPPPDPRELERLLNARCERLVRVRAH